MPRPYICLKKSMETQEQKFTRELANSRMQIELLRNQVLLRYYAQLLELDIMQHPKEVKTLMSSINTLERYARKYTPKDSAVSFPFVIGWISLETGVTSAESLGVYLRA